MILMKNLMLKNALVVTFMIYVTVNRWLVLHITTLRQYVRKEGKARLEYAELFIA